MKIVRRELFDTNIAFLDVITCAFGAIILLMMITKIETPSAPRPAEDPRAAEISALQRSLFRLRDDAAAATQAVAAKRQALASAQAEPARIKQQIAALTGRVTDAANQAAQNAEIAGELRIAQQRLTEEMQRLYLQRARAADDSIGGIPVDSEYIAFIIDTSGSMFNYAWRKVVDQIVETLQVYPRVKGMQVMSDEGTYMFQSYAGRWIPDTPALRREVVNRLLSFNVFSNSSPVEGIYAAMEQLYRPGQKMSLYVYGDEFTGRSIREAVDYVDRLNGRDAGGVPLVRIHAVGFPTQFANPPHLQVTGIRFATLMRELTHRNGGTFVGLNAFR